MPHVPRAEITVLIPISFNIATVDSPCRNIRSTHLGN
jgi:hypothetical protein